MASQKQNFRFQATASPHLAGVYPVFGKCKTIEKVSAVKSLLLEKRNISQSQTIWWYILVDVFQPNMISSFEILHYYQSLIGKILYVYARIIRYAIDFSTAITKRSFASFNELLFFFQEAVLQATYGHLLDRASYGQSDQTLQPTLKKREFELLKCCRIFQQRSQTDVVGNKELFKCDITLLNSDICHE